MYSALIAAITAINLQPQIKHVTVAQKDSKNLHHSKTDKKTMVSCVQLYL